MNPEHLHIETPLIESLALGRGIKGTAWLKMEALQPSGSFKLRGVGHACQQYVARGATALVTSSGGNAGLAVAYAGRKLGIPVTVVVPESTTERARELIEQEEARVLVKGESWNEAHEYARNKSGERTAYIHPFDDPLLWEGHGTIIDEIHNHGLKPDAVVLSVGGGGLLCGVLEGLHRRGWNDVPVLAVETLGANSLHAAIKAGQLVALDTITSIATSLGAKQVSRRAFDWTKQHHIVSHLVSDSKAVTACRAFVRDHRLLVEPACGAALAAVYEPVGFLKDKSDVLIIVCGGVGVTMEQLQGWLRQV
jgi:L-serine/L-threonine ammonia-lyase